MDPVCRYMLLLDHFGNGGLIMFPDLFCITITAAHLRLFACFTQQKPEDCITVQSKAQLKDSGLLPESMSPLKCGLSFT